MSKAPYYLELQGYARGINDEDLDIAVALLSTYAFDSFDTQNNTLRAFVKAQDITSQEQLEVQTLIDPYIDHIQWMEHEYENWNQKWEEHYFQPITIGDFHVRAPFHPESTHLHTITIEPRMSFGTGHHGTTRLMLEFIQIHQSAFKNARVLDMGTGTGILAIAAEKMGAHSVWGIEIDDWVVDNAKDNLLINTCQNTTISLGTADLLASVPDQNFDVVIANIHREVIIADLPEYTRVLKNEGRMFISGLQEEDIPMIDEKATSLGLIKDLQKSLESWQALVYLKPKL